ncbi:hypothetical protein Rhe02_49910 [Rhizocola hellebori]|uniref:Uncharacterized protein n=1 Tax=Rhizocola hellebori TaxID=1392758 RepID=A0A8J3VH09_9ACTN|nr:hypothetical protein [Rhizocola hellebori]GIH06924.1 hypothetical protein Rhe02_49910 [Rhizocola hellebori]
MPTQKRAAAKEPVAEPVTAEAPQQDLPPDDDDTPTLGVIDKRPSRCKTAGVDLTLTTISRPFDLADSGRVEAAGALMLIHQYGTRMGFFAAIDRARDLLDEDKLCLDFVSGQRKLLNALYCWPRLTEQLESSRIAAVKAKVLGIGDAGVPESERNTAIGPQLGRLVALLNRACNPGKCQDEPTTTELFELERAYRAVRFNLTMSTSTGTMLTIKEMKANLSTAVSILDGLADHLYLPCHLDATDGAFRSVLALVGDDLMAAGVDLTEAAEIAEAWQVIFSWLAYDASAAVAMTSIPDDLCGAAATLRPVPRDMPRFSLR